MNHDTGIESTRRIVVFFESLAPGDLARLGDVYAPAARFKDPFNEARGLAQIRQVYSHMFEALDGPRFAVTSRVVQGNLCFLGWDFRFRLRRTGAALTICGVSQLQLAPDGRIDAHRDYWDTAELYEQVPLLRVPMRWLRQRAGH